MASTDATPYPVKNQAYRVTFPLFDNDGDLVTGAASLDSEVSKDAGTFADCTNEATEIATSSGIYYLDLTATEMNADTVAIIIKTATTDAKTTPIILYPQTDGLDRKVDVTHWNGTAVPTPTTAGVPEVDVTFIAGQTASATGAVDFDDVAAILVDTATTIPGTITTVDANVDAIVAAVITNASEVDIAADIATIKAETATILVDTGTTLETHLTDIKGGTFSGATDSLEAIRDRGDSAWTTGAGGTPPQLLQNTTIATLASQTSFTLTAGSADDDAYNGAVVVVTDQSTSTQKAVGAVLDYIGATKTITLSADPGVFTMATGDTVDVIANASSAPTAASIRAEIDANSTQLAAIVADTNELQSDDVPGLIAALDAVVDTVKTDTAAILVDTGTTLPATLATIVADTNELQSDDVPGLIAALDAVVDTVKTDTAAILVDTGTTLPATLAALPAATDIVTGGAITTAAGVADVNVQQINDVTITGDGSGTPFNV